MAVNQETVILLCLMAFSSTLAARTPIEYKPCPGVESEGKLSTVDVNPCPAQPCVFHKGTTVNATIKFTPSVTVSNGTLETYGIIGGQPLPFPLPKPNACKGHNLECPLKAGQEYSMTISLFIKELYPSLQLIVKMDFKLPDKKYLFCFQFPAEIAK